MQRVNGWSLSNTIKCNHDILSASITVNAGNKQLDIFLWKNAQNKADHPIVYLSLEAFLVSGRHLSAFWKIKYLKLFL